MAYIVTAKNGIKDNSTGRSWAKGAPIGPAGFNPRLWQALLDEGSVVEVVEVPPVEVKPDEPVIKPEPVKKPARKRKVTK